MQKSNQLYQSQNRETHHTFTGLQNKNSPFKLGSWLPKKGLQILQTCLLQFSIIPFSTIHNSNTHTKPTIPHFAIKKANTWKSVPNFATMTDLSLSICSWLSLSNRHWHSTTISLDINYLFYKKETKVNLVLSF